MPDSTFERLKKEFAAWDQKSASKLFRKGMLKNLRTYKRRMDGDISPGAKYCLKHRRKIKPFLIPYAVFDSSILHWDSSKHIATALHIRSDIPFHEAFMFLDSICVGESHSFQKVKIPDSFHKLNEQVLPIWFYYDPLKKKFGRPALSKNPNKPDSAILRNENLISILRKANFYFYADSKKFPASLIHFNIGKSLKLSNADYSSTFGDATSNYLEYLRKDGVLELFQTHRKSTCELMIEERKKIKVLSPSERPTYPPLSSQDLLKSFKLNSR